MNPEVDAYIERSDRWPEVMTALRPILLGSGLTEEIKWAKPCYTHDGKNIVIIQPMKDFLALMFFKGALLDDAEGVLEEQGPNSRSARRIRFTSTQDVARLGDTIEACLAQAVAVEEAGVTLDQPAELALAPELQRRIDQEPQLRAAFEKLTPGRQREYNLYVTGAKQPATREARAERCVPKILAGRGFRER